MATYNKKHETTLAWMETRDRLSLEGRMLLRRVLNEVLDEIAVEYDAAILNGRVLEFQVDRNELKKRLMRTAKKELGTK